MIWRGHATISWDRLLGFKFCLQLLDERINVAFEHFGARDHMSHVAADVDEDMRGRFNNTQDARPCCAVLAEQRGLCNAGIGQLKGVLAEHTLVLFRWAKPPQSFRRHTSAESPEERQEDGSEKGEPGNRNDGCITETKLNTEKKEDDSKTCNKDDALTSEYGTCAEEVLPECFHIIEFDCVPYSHAVIPTWRLDLGCLPRVTLVFEGSTVISSEFVPSPIELVPRRHGLDSGFA
jgi:hypothetical protein